MLAEYGDDRQVSNLDYDDTRLHQQSNIVDTLICPRDNSADNDCDSEYDEVIVFEQVSNTIDDPTAAQPTRNGVDEDDNNSGKEGQTIIGNTTVPSILQVNDAWKVLQPELVELNNRHYDELNADRLVVRYTSNPPGSLRGLFATQDFKAREVTAEYFGRTGVDRVTVEASDYDATYTYADTEPGGGRGTTVTDA